MMEREGDEKDFSCRICRAKHIIWKDQNLCSTTNCLLLLFGNNQRQFSPFERNEEDGRRKSDDDFVSSPQFPRIFHLPPLLPSPSSTTHQLLMQIRMIRSL